MKRAISLILVFILAVCLFPTNAFASYSQTEVTMYGTKDKPTGASNSSQNKYYSYFTNTAYWVGGNYNRSGKTVYMVQAYLYADGEFSSTSSIDGWYGDDTYQKIRNYQYKYVNDGLAEDGVVGGDTWYHMVYLKYHDAVYYYLPYSPHS